MESRLGEDLNNNDIPRGENMADWLNSVKQHEKIWNDAEALQDAADDIDSDIRLCEGEKWVSEMIADLNVVQERIDELTEPINN